MSLYVGDDKNKCWEDLLDSLSRFEDKWGDAKLITFAVQVCDKNKDGSYVAWLAKCALHLQAKLKEAEHVIGEVRDCKNVCCESCRKMAARHLESDNE